MNRKTWKRLWREKGWLPFGILAALVIATLIPLQSLVGTALDTHEESTRKEAALENIRAKQQRSPDIEKTLASEQFTANVLTTRLVQLDAKGTAAGPELGKRLQDWLASLDIQQAAVVASSRREAEGLTFLRAEIEATMGIEQFTRLLQNKRTAPLSLRLVEMTAEANDLVSPSALRVRMAWEALAAPPRPEPPKEKTAAKKKEEVARPDDRGSRAKPAAIEERRR